MAFCLKDSVSRATAWKRIAADIRAALLEPEDTGIGEILEGGIHAMNQGALHQAYDLSSRVIARNPRFAEGWNKRATVLFMPDDLEGSAPSGMSLTL